MTVLNGDVNGRIAVMRAVLRLGHWSVDAADAIAVDVLPHGAHSAALLLVRTLAVCRRRLCVLVV